MTEEQRINTEENVPQQNNLQEIPNLIKIDLFHAQITDKYISSSFINSLHFSIAKSNPCLA